MHDYLTAQAFGAAVAHGIVTCFIWGLRRVTLGTSKSSTSQQTRVAAIHPDLWYCSPCKIRRGHCLAPVVSRQEIVLADLSHSLHEFRCETVHSIVTRFLSASLPVCMHACWLAYLHALSSACEFSFFAYRLQYTSPQTTLLRLFILVLKGQHLSDLRISNHYCSNE